jgi:tellurite resistance protein
MQGGAEAAAPARLAHLPMSLFAMVMGLAGLAIATERLAVAIGAPPATALPLLALTALLFVLLLALHAVKAVRHPAAVGQEWRHPVMISFFPTASISLILLATAVMPFSPRLAEPLWLVGTAAHLVAMLAIVTVWIDQSRFETAHLNPAWFIPAVGNVLVPLAGVPLGYAEPSWFFLAVGLLFWLVLLTIVFNRLVFHHPLPERLLPTLCILIAPPAVAFLAWLRLTGEVGMMGRVLYDLALFFFLLVLLQLPRLARLPFALSWWAYSFPLAALTVATFAMAAALDSALLRLLAFGLYALLALVVAGLLVRTLKAALAGEILRPHG